MTDPIAHFSRRARSGDSEAWYYLGAVYERENAPEKALECFRKGAALGDSRGLHRLAMAYWRGDGVKRDRLLAKQLLGEAVCKGSAASACVLGLLCFDEYTEEGTSEALKWFDAAAGLGDAGAMIFAAVKIYLSGDHRMNSFADRDKGIQLLERAASRGSSAALLFLFDEYSGDRQSAIADEYFRRSAGRARRRRS